MSQEPTRRDFIKNSTALGGAALGVAWWVGANTVAKAQDSNSPLERINFACIGVNGKGNSDSGDAAKNGNVVAICDIDDNSLNRKAGTKGFKEAKKYNDYRLMLDEMGEKIDAVTVSIPDHSHAPASMMAMKMGKHCFCQKPLTWSVAEARLMRETAAEMNVATQMGNQGTSGSGLREAVEIIRSGALGDIKDVHIWTNRPSWPQATGRPEKGLPIPNHVHWYLFLGPATDRPYHSAYHPFNWRGWLDYGTGALGDMACHTANLAVMAAELFEPTSIVADHTGIVDNETYPKSSKIVFQFPQRGKLPPCKMTWYDGKRFPPSELLQGERMPKAGSLLIGDKGSLLTPRDYGQRYVLLPRKKYADYTPPEPTLPRSPGHFKEFAIACRGGSPAMSNFNYAARLTETILLGNVAMKAGSGTLIEWDAKNLKVTNNKEANKFISREYRDGWSL